MKPYLTHLFLYALPVIIAILICIPIIKSQLDIAFRSPQYLALPDSITTLVIGDSHTANGLDEQLMTKSCNNSISAETLYYTYHRLAYLLRYNPQVEVVVLSYGEHAIAKSKELLNLETQESEMYRRYSQIVPLDANLFTGINTYKCILEQSGFPFKANLEMCQKLIMNDFRSVDFPFWGCSQMMDGVNIGDEKIIFGVQKNYSIPQTSSLALQYLDSIVHLCASHSLKLFLYEAPIHKKYAARIPEVIHQAYLQTIKSYCDDSTVFYLGYRDYPLLDSCYLNGDHINRIGVGIITPMVARDIEARISTCH